MTDTKLKPCPLCGGVARHTNGHHKKYNPDPWVLCPDCQFGCIKSKWNRLPRPSSEARDIAREMREVSRDTIASGFEVPRWIWRLVDWASRLEQAADSGACVYCGNAGGDMRDGAAQTMCDDAEGCDGRVRAQSNADVPSEPKKKFRDTLWFMKDDYEAQLGAPKETTEGETKEHDTASEAFDAVSDLANQVRRWVKLNRTDQDAHRFDRLLNTVYYAENAARSWITRDDCAECDKRIEYEGLHAALEECHDALERLWAKHKIETHNLNLTMLSYKNRVPISETLLVEGELDRCQRRSIRLKKESDDLRDALERKQKELDSDVGKLDSQVSKNKACMAALEECHDALERLWDAYERKADSSKIAWVSNGEYQGRLYKALAEVERLKEGIRRVNNNVCRNRVPGEAVTTLSADWLGKQFDALIDDTNTDTEE